MFKTRKDTNHKKYSIALKSKNGNTVGFINLSSHFTKAVMKKLPEEVTVKDLDEKFPNGIESYLMELLVEISEVDNHEETINPEEF